ncbi:hypothetical protein D9757_001018 [Collybiopsis confluens]|uniref:Cupin type-2 domain-containing protein n=1 Tax=Collybiopsis confluens TaxID=2823264 RepID=A0A8H5MGE6_9AGAR|nr:hypothetical protein D9757_001018 [Collybiopsis confluens]
MSSDFPETMNFGKGMRMTFENNIRRVEVGGQEGDDIFYVPTHWHENHDEMICVLEGQLEVTLGKGVIICTPAKGDVVVPRGVPHSLKGIKGVACVFTERTNPGEFPAKELFFRNMFSLQGQGGLLPVMLVFYAGDIFPVFPVHSVWLEKAVKMPFNPLEDILTPLSPRSLSQFLEATSPHALGID